MSSQSAAPPPLAKPTPPRRRYGWWIAGGIFAVLIAMLAGFWLHFGESIKFANNLLFGMVTGDPHFPGSDTTIVREDTAGPLGYRVSKVKFPDQSEMYYVYAKSSPNAGYWLVLMSDDTCVPESIRQTDDGNFQVVFKTPLADGRTSVPLVLNKDGSVGWMFQVFEHGRPHESPSAPK
jgi:hypothetical protein